MPPTSVCSTLRCVRFIAHTSLFSLHVKDSATTAGLAPCERVFHAQVCALQITHISILAARQRQFHDGRTCPAIVCSTLGCVTFSAHTSLFSRHVKDRATTAGLAPCERGSPAQVCALERLHTLTLPARPKTAPRRQGLLLRAYVPRSGVCTSAPTRLDSRSASEDRATTAWLAPASVCPPPRCVHVSAFTPLLSLRV